MHSLPKIDVLQSSRILLKYPEIPCYTVKLGSSGFLNMSDDWGGSWDHLNKKTKKHSSSSQQAAARISNAAPFVHLAKTLKASQEGSETSASYPYDKPTAPDNNTFPYDKPSQSTSNQGTNSSSSQQSAQRPPSTHTDHARADMGKGTKVSVMHFNLHYITMTV